MPIADVTFFCILAAVLLVSVIVILGEFFRGNPGEPSGLKPPNQLGRQRAPPKKSQRHRRRAP